MPGRIFFRDAHATVTASELIVGRRVYPLAEILSARSVRRRTFLPWPFSRFMLFITTPTGQLEVLRHRNGYVVFQLAQAIHSALREGRQDCAQVA